MHISREVDAVQWASVTCCVADCTEETMLELPFLFQPINCIANDATIPLPCYIQDRLLLDSKSQDPQWRSSLNCSQHKWSQARRALVFEQALSLNFPLTTVPLARGFSNTHPKPFPPTPTLLTYGVRAPQLIVVKQVCILQRWIQRNIFTEYFYQACLSRLYLYIHKLIHICKDFNTAYTYS